MPPVKTRAASGARFILVFLALFLPTLSLIPLGGFYLWEKGWLLWWTLGALSVVAIVTAVERLILAPKPAESEPVAESVTGQIPELSWNASEEQAWADVLAISSRIDIDKISSFEALFELGHETVNAVARRLHPDKSDALWRFTLPEAFAITERVSRRLGQFADGNIPFSDRLTVSQFLGLYRWRNALDVADRAYDVWRIIRLVNPAAAVTNEARERLSRAMFQWGREHAMRRMIEAYVEEVGRAAIDLYGGRLRVRTAASATSETAPLPTGPTRILVAGAASQQRAKIADELALSAPKWPMAGNIEVVTSAADPASRRFAAVASEEIKNADLIVWTVAQGQGLSDPERAALADAAKYFAATPAVIAPPLLGMMSGPTVVSGDTAPITKEALKMMLSAAYGRNIPAVVPSAGEPGGASSQELLSSAILTLLPLAERTKAVRAVHQAKSGRGWVDTGGQAVIAAGRLAKALIFKTRGEPPKSK